MHNVLQSSRYELVAVVLFLVAVTLFGCRRRVISVKDVDEMIKKQVPVGSDKRQVKAFIDSLKVDSLRIVRDADFHQANRDPIGTLDPEKTDQLGDRIAEFVGARIVDVETGFWYHEDIRIEFYIDKGGQMIDYTVKRAGWD